MVSGTRSTVQYSRFPRHVPATDQHFLCLRLCGRKPARWLTMVHGRSSWLSLSHFRPRGTRGFFLLFRILDFSQVFLLENGDVRDVNDDCGLGQSR